MIHKHTETQNGSQNIMYIAGNVLCDYVRDEF